MLLVTSKSLRPALIQGKGSERPPLAEGGTRSRCRRAGEAVVPVGNAFCLSGSRSRRAPAGPREGGGFGAAGFRIGDIF